MFRPSRRPYYPPKPAPAPTKPAPINSIYDRVYFDAANNEYYSRKNNNYLWWASSNRESGSEYVEIDLGKRRGINYISFDIITKPIDIEIEYDRIDLDDLNQYSDAYDRRWTPVKKIEDATFDSSISYIADRSNPWKHAEFFFTDENGEFLVARRLRFKFTRRDERWPTAQYPKFAYGVDVKNLRVARYISERSHLRGLLFGAEAFDKKRTFADEIRQNVVIPAAYEITPKPTTDLSAIGNYTPQKIYPRISQFNFLVMPQPGADSAVFEWSFVDVTNYEIVISRGTQPVGFTAVSQFGDSAMREETMSPTFPEWVRITFPEEIEVQSNRQYQMRIRNLTPGLCKEYFVTSPSVNASGTSTATIDLHQINSLGGFDRIRNTSMTYQIVAHVGASGKDLLGNEYRESVRYYDAEAAVDGKIATNWTCFPNPSQDGVEALYLDVRQLVDGVLKPSVFDALVISTLTPGVRMNVYYSDQPVDGRPGSVDEWESMMWTPVRSSFRLNQRQTIDLPYPVKANWICLEFYNLQPQSIELPNYPILPEVPYKEFPQWVIDANDTEIALNDVPMLEKEKFVDFTVPDVVAPTIENKEGLRVYAETPRTLEQNYAINGFGTADPKLLSNISISKNMYAQPTITRVDTQTLLGANMYEKYSTDLTRTFSAEAPQYPRVINSRSVSNTNDRGGFARTQDMDIIFNRVCAHQYAEKRARYNKKAFFVSVSEVAFFRKDYSIEGDDPVIHDVLVYEDVAQSPFIEESSWEPERRISIPVGGPLFVTYEVNGVQYQDELIYLEPKTSTEASFQPIDLPGVGGIATNVIARSAPFGKGETYYRNQDFLIVYDAASKKNRIQRNDIPARLVISEVDNSVDRFTVNGSAIIITEVDDGDDIAFGTTGVAGTVGGSTNVTGEITSGLGNGSVSSTTTIYATLDDE